MAMVDVTVKAKGPDVFQVHIGNKKLKFNAKGEATAKLSDEGFHLIRWFVMGDKGDEYSIAITKPSFVGFSFTNTLDEEGQDAGHQWFSVRE